MLQQTLTAHNPCLTLAKKGGDSNADIVPTTSECRKFNLFKIFVSSEDLRVYRESVRMNNGLSNNHRFIYATFYSVRIEKKRGREIS